MHLGAIFILCASAQFYAKAIFVIGRLQPFIKGQGVQNLKKYALPFVVLFFYINFALAIGSLLNAIKKGNQRESGAVPQL